MDTSWLWYLFYFVWSSCLYLSGTKYLYSTRKIKLVIETWKTKIKFNSFFLLRSMKHWLNTNLIVKYSLDSYVYVKSTFIYFFNLNFLNSPIRLLEWSCAWLGQSCYERKPREKIFWTTRFKITLLFFVGFCVWLVWIIWYECTRFSPQIFIEML